MGRRTRRAGLRLGGVAIVMPLIVGTLLSVVSWPHFVPVVDAVRGAGVHGVLSVEKKDCTHGRFGKSCVAVGTFRSNDGTITLSGTHLSKSGFTSPGVGSRVKVSYQHDGNLVYREGGIADPIVLGGGSVLAALCWAWLAWCGGLLLKARFGRGRRVSSAGSDVPPRYFTHDEIHQMGVLLDRLVFDPSTRLSDNPAYLDTIRDFSRNGEEQLALIELAEWISAADASLTQEEFDFLVGVARVHDAQSEIAALEGRIR